MGFLEFPIRRYQFTLVAFMCLVALGLFAFNKVPREEDPYFKIPGYTIAKKIGESEKAIVYLAASAALGTDVALKVNRASREADAHRQALEREYKAILAIRDPAVVRIARDPQKFTFLTRCVPGARIEVGDARLLIEHAPSASKDILVLDAFSSDSVPMHLLTKEAFADYRRVVSANGLLLVHISNRYLDLRPVIASGGETGGWTGSLRRYRPDPEGFALNETGSDWIALSQNPSTVERLVMGTGEQWTPLRHRRGFAPWTDDHASVLPLISFSQ